MNVLQENGNGLNGNHHALPGDTTYAGFVGSDETDAQAVDDLAKSMTVLFSVHEEVGALAKCLKIFEVRISMMNSNVQIKTLPVMRFYCTGIQ